MLGLPTFFSFVFKFSKYLFSASILSSPILLNLTITQYLQPIRSYKADHTPKIYHQSSQPKRLQQLTEKFPARIDRPNFVATFTSAERNHLRWIDRFDIFHSRRITTTLTTRIWESNEIIDGRRERPVGGD